MMTSACMGFRATSSYLDGVYFLPADAPLFSLYTLRREAKEFSWADADLFRPVYQGEPGHPLLIRTSFFPVIYNYQGECGLRGICETYSDRLHEIPGFRTPALCWMPMCRRTMSAWSHMTGARTFRRESAAWS